MRTFGSSIVFLMCVAFALNACGESTNYTADDLDAAANDADVLTTEDDVYEFSANFIPQAGSPTINAYEYIKSYLI